MFKKQIVLIPNFSNRIDIENRGVKIILAEKDKNKFKNIYRILMNCETESSRLICIHSKYKKENRMRS